MNRDAKQTSPADEWLGIVQQQVASLKFGLVQITVHQSRVVQIECTEKIWIPGPPPRRATEQEPEGPLEATRSVNRASWIETKGNHETALAYWVGGYSDFAVHRVVRVWGGHEH